MNEPRTEAGKALLDTLRREWQPDPPYHSEVSIVAIEDEARADLLAEVAMLREALAALLTTDVGATRDQRYTSRTAKYNKAHAALTTTAARASIEAPDPTWADVRPLLKQVYDAYNSPTKEHRATKRVVAFFVDQQQLLQGQPTERGED